MKRKQLGDFNLDKSTFEEMLFYKNGKIRQPGNKIIQILCPKQQNVNDSYLKSLQNSDEISLLTYDTIDQLKIDILKQRAKKLYLLDLQKSQGKTDAEVNIIATFEAIKDGRIVSPSFEIGQSLLMESPHLILVANQLFNPEFQTGFENGHRARTKFLFLQKVSRNN